MSSYAKELERLIRNQARDILASEDTLSLCRPIHCLFDLLNAMNSNIPKQTPNAKWPELGCHTAMLTVKEDLYTTLQVFRELPNEEVNPAKPYIQGFYNRLCLSIQKGGN